MDMNTSDDWQLVMATIQVATHGDDSNNLVSLNVPQFRNLVPVATMKVGTEIQLSPEMMRLVREKSNYNTVPLSQFPNKASTGVLHTDGRFEATQVIGDKCILVTKGRYTCIYASVCSVS